MPDQDYIHASEIAEYIYCHRAWWLRLSGYTSQNQEALAQGAAGHTQYSGDIAQVQRQARIGRLVLFLGAILLIVFILLRLFVQ